MNIREASSSRRTYSQPKSSRPVKVSSFRPVIVLMVILVLVLGWLFIGKSPLKGIGSPIKSGWSGYCLDDYLSQLSPGNHVDLWPCNGSSAQDWQVSLTGIRHNNTLCLTASSITSITIQNCQKSPDQVWLRDGRGFLDPDRGLCLTSFGHGQGQQLSLQKCQSLTSKDQQWTPNLNYSSYTCSGDQGQVVACNAIKQWIIWTNQPNNHESLLSAYTANDPSEEWCADFISYVYKASGYPFTNGDYEGWDEEYAPAIIDQGFTQQTKNYVPQVGDIGYFNYPGGHVEIVVVGGQHPTFIYGNSDTIDPTTGNGQMAANDLTKDKTLGSLVYYLSPSSST